MMNLAEICIIKRDGKREDFSPSKIANAIGKAFEATGMTDQTEVIESITQQVINHIGKPTIGVEEIQDLVETELMKVQPEVAKSISSTDNGEIRSVSAKPKSSISWTVSWRLTRTMSI